LLFAGSDRGGQRAALLYSLIVTAKLNGVDPQAWLADVLHRINDHRASRLHALLPWNWKAWTATLAEQDPIRSEGPPSGRILNSAMIPFFWPRCRSCSLSATASRLGGIRTRR
jgi:hypothetical protein